MATQTCLAAADGYYAENATIGDSPGYKCVDEASPHDGDSTHLANFDESTTKCDTPTFQEYTGSDNITKVTFHAVMRHSIGFGNYDNWVRLRTHDTDYDTYQTITGEYVDYSYEKPNNPYTGVAWTKAEVNAVQFGCKNVVGGKPTTWPYCTQIYIVVEYTTSGWSNIAKVCGVSAANISKVDGVAKASISKLLGKSV